MCRIVIDAQHALRAVDDRGIILRAVIRPRSGHRADRAAVHAIDAEGVVVHRDGAAVGKFLIERAELRFHLFNRLPDQILDEIRFIEYAQGTGEWDAVKTAFVDGWAKEYKAANEG